MENMSKAMPEASNTREQERQQVTVSAILVALGTLTSRGLGFVRDIAIAHFFSRTATDAFFVAFRLPNLFRRLFGEGALTVSFIPVLTDFIKNDDKKGARELCSAVFTMLFVVLSILTFIGTWGPEWLVKPLTQGAAYTSVPGKVDLTIHQTKIMFCYIMLVSLYAYAMGILNTLRMFWLPAVAPALWNVAMIAGILFFRQFFAIPSDVLAWSSVAGGFLQLGILIPSLIKRGFFPKFTKWWGNPAVRKVFKAMGPSILGLSVMQLGVIINTYLASHLEEGSNSWIFWADRILELPLSLFAVSVGTAALPALAALWSRGEKSAMRDASLHALKLSFFMAFPCAAGVFFLSQPIVRTLFEHGLFRAHDTEMTAAIIQIYGIQMIFAAGVRVLAPTFYAMKNTWLPALSAAISLTFHVILANILIHPLGVLGLSTSSVCSSALNFAILVYSYKFTGERLRFVEILPNIGKLVLGCVGLYAASLSYKFFHNLAGDSHIGRIISLTAVISLCVVVYGVICWFLKVQELHESLGGLKRKLSKVFAKKIITA